MTREYIINKLKTEISENKNIDSIFVPLIEEFFVRLVEIYNFSEEDIKHRLYKYRNVRSMNLSKWKDNIYKELGYTEQLLYFDDQKNKLQVEEIHIKVSSDYLKYILKGNEKKIEEFIDTVFHEQGHLIQFETNSGKEVDNGLSREVYNDEDESVSCCKYGILLNEYAEIVNAHRLVKGSIKDKEYSGYDKMIGVLNVVLDSLGISESELAELQMKGIGRRYYEELIEKKLGKNYRTSLVALEKTLDNIFLIDNEMNNATISRIKELLINMEIQCKTLNDLTNTILKMRAEKLGRQPDMNELAKIVLDKNKRDNDLSNAIEQLKTDLPIGFSIDFEPNVLEEFVLNIHNEQLGKKMDELKKLENDSDDISFKYDNSVLMQKLKKIALECDISKFSLKDRVELTVYRTINSLKEIFLKSNKIVLESGDSKPIMSSKDYFFNNIKVECSNMYGKNVECNVDMEEKNVQNENVR